MTFVMRALGFPHRNTNKSDFTHNPPVRALSRRYNRQSPGGVKRHGPWMVESRGKDTVGEEPSEWGRTGTLNQGILRGLGVGAMWGRSPLKQRLWEEGP